ncbi:glycosyltransferase [Patescibacteria group bacterium]|nr:glycosyltransferase [Patescibacteria group bacterium]
MPKQVLIFSLSYYPNFIGGAEIAIKEIANRIPPDEIAFTMITLRYEADAPEEEIIGNIRVYRVGKGKKNLSYSSSFAAEFYFHKILFVPQAALKALSLHKKIHFDGAWAMMTYMLFPLVLMRLRGVRIPYALTLQEGDPFERVFERWRIRLFSPLLFYGIRHAAVVQVISHFLGTWARKCGYKGILEVIPNGIPLKEFSHPYSSHEILAKKRELEKKEGEVYLVTTSRLVHKNAVDDVIRALALLPEHIFFIIYGIGPDEEMLRSLAKGYAVESRVKFMNQIAHADLPLALVICDIFIRPSRSEGMGNSFIEAMALGLPVIATQEGGIADFLFDEKRNPEKETTGWAVDVDSPQHIADAVSNILNTPEKVLRVTNNAKKMVQEKYDWKYIGETIHTMIFNQLL